VRPRRGRRRRTRDALAFEPADAVRHTTSQIVVLTGGTRTHRGDVMDIDAALQSQIRNIETTYDKPLDHWFAVIDGST
jgi:hypothetical protein